MPYINIKLTREGGTQNSGPSVEQKAELIKGCTELMMTVLNKDPKTTMVIIDEIDLSDWGIGGLPVREYRLQEQKV